MVNMVKLKFDRWILMDKTTPSGKSLFLCSSCGRESIAPDKLCPDERCATAVRHVVLEPIYHDLRDVTVALVREYAHPAREQRWLVQPKARADSEGILVWLRAADGSDVEVLFGSPRVSQVVMPYPLIIVMPYPLSVLDEYIGTPVDAAGVPILWRVAREGVGPEDLTV